MEPIEFEEYSSEQTTIINILNQLSNSILCNSNRNDSNIFINVDNTNENQTGQNSGLSDKENNTKKTSCQNNNKNICQIIKQQLIQLLLVLK